MLMDAKGGKTRTPGTKMQHFFTQGTQEHCLDFCPVDSNLGSHPELVRQFRHRRFG
jgi:hypothetical protein